MSPVKVGSVVTTQCSCGETFSGVVAAVESFGDGGPALAFLTHQTCRSTRCVAVCRTCHVPVEQELERCLACHDEQLVAEVLAS